MTSTSTQTDVIFLLPLNELAGAERSMLRVIKGLAEHGQHVRLVTYGKQPQLAEAILPKEHVYFLGTQRTLGALYPLIRLLKKTTPEILISSTRHANVMAVVAAQIANTGTRVIAVEHSALSSGFSNLHSWKHRFMQKIVHHFYRKADCVVAVSQGMAVDLRTMLQGHAPVKTMYNPIVEDAPQPSTPNPPHPWLADTTAPVIMAIGRLSAEKGMADLIRAFAVVRKLYNARLIILGEGEERTALEHLTKQLSLTDDVLLVGYQDNAQAWLAHATMFVSPSLFEGFGNAIVEAMALGIPVIATDCPVGPREILCDGKYGALVPVSNPQALCDAITHTLQNPPHTSAALQRAQNFTVSKSVSNYQAMIASMKGQAATHSLTQRITTRLASMFLQEHWMIGIINTPIETSLTWKTCQPVRWIPTATKSCYLADPFALPHHPQTLLCEHVNHYSGKGELVKIKLNDNNIIENEAKVTLDTGNHLSFPFTFSHEGQLYCLPESCADNCLTLYQQTQSGSWKKHSTILPSTPAVDSVLFTHENRFWIAYTDISMGTHNNLNLLYADTLDGTWHPHPHNPVRISKRNARNGGTPFAVNDRLYRIAQDCSLTYGGALSIMEVMQCTPDAYLEKEVNHISPDVSGINPVGLHTLSKWGERCLVDGKHYRFSLEQTFCKVKSKFLSP